jgi:Flp pilus assembly pilin Flp
MFRKLWKDDAGIVATEYMFVATIVGIGVTVGLSNLAAAINVELSETGEALMGMNQGYVVGAAIGSNGNTDDTIVKDLDTPDLTYANLGPLLSGTFQIVDNQP